MSCCRGRSSGIRTAPADAGPCKVIEQGGAGLRFWLLSVQGSYQLCIRTPEGSLVNVETFLSSYRCSGPAARVVRNSLSKVLNATSKNPGAFLRHAASGVSLVQLLRTADSVLAGSAQNGKKLPAFTNRS